MVDSNGFLAKNEKICQTCAEIGGYKKFANGRLRRVKICDSCKSATPKFEGNWSEDFTRPVGTRGGFEQ